ncbi:Leucine-rich repeat receptor protein kinase [Quillaja saponaria]|uniref:Leucine-rich repeat receptor protein kinase n=1 Tax=Quillaja saponaria TaxID=32244 RepID=A0AAD7M746_QUISA|nr:Leucine-rich repeat receptor protein kinase [Quillaja saponaria]
MIEKSATMNALCVLQFFLLLLLLLIRCNSVFGEVEIKCTERERRLLLKIKDEFIDDYGHLSSWGNEDNKRECCKWRGIRCDKQTGHVNLLNLHVTDCSNINYMPLRGKISSSLIQLNYLKVLDLKCNDFSDQLDISDFIGSLKGNLSYLDLSFSHFGGRFPSQVVNLSTLQYLDLSYNNFLNVRDIESFSRLSSLEHLDLSGNNLTASNDSFYVVNKLPSLKTLILSSCGLEDVHLPSSLSYLNNSSSSFSSSLENLDLSANDFSASLIYKWLFKIGKNLMVLNLSANPLQGSIPDEFGDVMFSLEHLKLEFSELRDGIPKSVGNLCELRTLRMDYNNLSGKFEEFIGNLSGCSQNSLEVLSLLGNQLSGTFSDNITRFSSLKELYVARNQLNGTFFETSSAPISILNILDLSKNLLEGSLPNLSSSFPSLTELYLVGNQFTGNPANSFSHLFNLEKLAIGNNSFEGTPTEASLSKLSGLKQLYLSSNSQLYLRISSDWIPPFQLDWLHLESCNLGPKFPNWIKTQRNFSFFDISNNEISGTIPTWLWDLSPKVTFLDLSHNQFSGKLPDLLTLLYGCRKIDFGFNNLEGPLPLLPSNLTYLNLSKNRFSGSLQNICKMVALMFLDLSDNMLSGEIPSCQMQYHGLSILNLANNNLSGKIPSSIGTLSKLELLDLRNNSLSGELPSSLKRCKLLELIDFGDNKFSGEIPSWIGESLCHLSFLILRSNEFYGEIPIQMCQLSKIKILDLSINNISGIIPECINNFSMMHQKGNLTTAHSISYFSFSHPAGSDFGNLYYDARVLVFKEGRRYEYGRSRELLRIIDLSENKLTGDIPSQLTNLSALVALNLSRNSLNGNIPPKIGLLKELLSLDLSRNHLSGDIPSSMADLTFLNCLDLSYNKFSGKIPSSTQLQSFNASQFIGNPLLCGLPLLQKCPGDKSSDPSQPTKNASADTVQEDEDEFEKWFYTGMGIGFAVGFWVICGSLILKRSWRHAYFLLMINIKDWVYVMIAVHWARLQRRFRS